MLTMRRPTKRNIVGQSSPSYAPTSTSSNETTIISPHNHYHHHRSSSTSNSHHRCSRRRLLHQQYHTHNHHYRPIFLVVCLTIGAFCIFQTISSIVSLESNYYYFLRRTSTSRHDKNNLDNDPSTIILETLINRSDIVVNRLLNFTHRQIISSSSSSSSSSFAVLPPRQSKRYDHRRKDQFWKRMKHFNFSSSWNESTVIPHNLWFTNKHDVLFTKTPFHYYENVVNTIQRYVDAFRRIDGNDNDNDNNAAPTTKTTTTHVEFATDEDCVAVLDVTATLIESVENLTSYFREETDGTYKSDICRLGLLYIYGGYYFDVDMKVVTPIVAETIEERIPPRPAREDHSYMQWYMMNVNGLDYDTAINAAVENHNQTQQQQTTSPNTNITFMTAIDTPREYFFQSFLACTPRHPIIESALRYIALHYQGKTLIETEDKLLGPITLIMAYHNVTKVHPNSIGDDGRSDYSSEGMYWEDLGLGQSTSYIDYFEDPMSHHDMIIEELPIPVPANVTPFQENVYASSFIFRERELSSDFLPHYPRQNASSDLCQHVVYQEITNHTPRVYFYSRIVGSRACPSPPPPPSLFANTLPYLQSLIYDDPSGTCGSGLVGNGRCKDKRDCCSSFGYCGRSNDFCDDDERGGWHWQSGLRSWLKGYGRWRGTCGDGIVGDGRCPDVRDCCSWHGYCGRDADFCLHPAKVVDRRPLLDTWTWFRRKLSLLVFRLLLAISRDTCGGGIIGTGVCVNETECCSIKGYCGTTSEICEEDVWKLMKHFSDNGEPVSKLTVG